MNIVIKELKDETATIKLAQNVAQALEKPCLIFLSGDLGAGKTTFARGFIKAMTNIAFIPSPTFSYLNIYEGIAKVYHFDLYRAQNLDEIFNLGLMDFLVKEEAFRLVEWPEKLSDYITPNIAIELSLHKRGRIAKIVSKNHLDLQS